MVYFNDVSDGVALIIVNETVGVVTWNSFNVTLEFQGSVRVKVLKKGRGEA